MIRISNSLSHIHDMLKDFFLKMYQRYLMFTILSTQYKGISANILFSTILQVVLYVNKVGPYFNPHETYHYYQLPVCRPKKVCSFCTEF